MRFLLKIAVAIFAAAPLHASPLAEQFDQLPDPAAAIFDDPFREMGLEDLEKLRTVVRLEARLETEAFDRETRERLSANAAEARRWLIEGGHDIDALLAARWEVARNRKRALIATNSSFEGAEVMIDGFLIPAERDPDGVAVGYLVSEVGLCSHKPSPPPNRLVRVRYDGDLPAPNLYLPVSVIGTLSEEPGDQSIFLLDGTVRMISMWNLAASRIVVNGPIGIPNASSANFDPLSGDGEIQNNALD